MRIMVFVKIISDCRARHLVTAQPALVSNDPANEGTSGRGEEEKARAGNLNS